METVYYLIQNTLPVAIPLLLLLLAVCSVNEAV